MPSHDPHIIPHYLDEPFKLILWTLDEVFGMALPLFIGWYFFGAFLVGACLSAVALILIKKIKGEQGSHYLLYLLYWHLPPLYQFKMIPPSYQREWLG
jgi:conjugal transfer pilus assembly protein TraL